MAATFNRDLMTEIGKVIGNNCLKAGVSILYGPGNKYSQDTLWWT